MYAKIYVPVDNSEHSNAAIEVAVRLAKTLDAALVGCHVYAARMHDVRFKQMEYTLPDEYQDEQELDRQRRIHDSLITRGLQLISDSYLDVMKGICEREQIGYDYRTFDGKNWECLVQDIAASDYDLVVMGALGMGAVKDSQIGSVTDRVVRRIRVDSLVVRDPHSLRDDASDRIVVGVDGSPQAFAGLRTALALGKALGKRVEAVSVYDPYLHYAMFNGIVDVLSAEASKVFRFKEQEQLHEEIIDTGLAKIYESHLRVAASIARDEGVPLTTTLFDGKAFKKILQHVRQDPPWLLVTGRIGVHSADQMDIGSNTDNLLRMAPCNVLLSSRAYVPPVDLQAEASVVWTEEAEARMERVPAAFRGITRTAICRYAMERGHSIISSSIIDDAVAEVMPEHAARAMGVEPRRTPAAGSGGQREEGGARVDRQTWICRRCGRSSHGDRPQACAVCEGTQFQAVDKAAVAAAARQEGEVVEEEAFDGFKVKWTAEARAVLSPVPKGYERRRVKARIEKLARVRRLPSITRDFAQANLDEAYAPVAEAVSDRLPASRSASADGNGELRWTDEAAARMEHVPGGFMRVMARAKVEEFAQKIHATEVTLDVVEGGLADARDLMHQSLKAYTPEQVEAAMKAHGHGSTADPDGPGTVSSPGWTEDGVRRLNEVEITAAEKFDPARARELAQHAAESRAARTSEAINAAFLERLGIKIGYGHPLSPKTFEHYFQWTPEAEARLEALPSYCRELSRWRVEWTAYKKGLGPLITPEVMDVKFDMWGQVSTALVERGPSLAWEAAAEARLANMPPFVRGQVMEAIEGNARELGEATVTPAVMDRVIAKWIATGDFHEGRYGFKA
ncbi:MAG TPA: universal stress protein [Candidatus Limnocylindrales bacterium]|nr:universal stress protein [Candidatus Limnocylindrales bacterium]